MQFYLNGEKIDITLEDEKTIGDVLKAFELNCEQNDAAVIGIKINDQNITAEIFDETSAKKLEDNDKFEFTVITRQNIEDSFSKLSSLFVELSKNMEQISVKLQGGKEREAHESIKNLADSIDEFCHIATLASLFKEYSNIKIDGKAFSEFFGDFSPVLRDFEQALKSNDTVTVGDLAEYEICPRLEAIAKTLEGIS